MVQVPPPQPKNKGVTSVTPLFFRMLRRRRTTLPFAPRMAIICARAPNKIIAPNNARKWVVTSPTSATKKDSIVDRVSAMEFCFIYGKCLVFALKLLFPVVLRAFFLIKPINPPLLAPVRQKRRILYRSRVQSFKE